MMRIIHKFCKDNKRMEYFWTCINCGMVLKYPYGYGRPYCPDAHCRVTQPLAVILDYVGHRETFAEDAGVYKGVNPRNKIEDVGTGSFSE